MDRRMVSTLLLGGLLVLGGCGRAEPDDDGELFHTGRRALTEGRFDAARRDLEKYLQTHPSGSLASRASFLIAKSYLGDGDLQKAQEGFESTIGQFGDSEEAHKSRYKLAVIHVLAGRDADAIDAFNAVIKSSPGPLVPEAQAMVRMLQGRNLPAEQPMD